MQVRQVNPQYIAQMWPDVSGYLSNALKFSGGEYTVEHLKVYLTQGTQALLIAEDDNNIRGAASVSIIKYPNDTVAFVNAIGGKLITSPDMFDQLINWAKAQGCTKIQGAARESIERLWRIKFGFTERYRIVEKSL